MDVSVGSIVTGSRVTPMFSCERWLVREIATPWNSSLDRLSVFLWSRLSKSPVVNTPECILVDKTTPSSSIRLHTLRVTAIFTSRTHSYYTESPRWWKVWTRCLRHASLCILIPINSGKGVSRSLLCHIWTTVSDDDVYVTMLYTISWQIPHATLDPWSIPASYFWGPSILNLGHWSRTSMKVNSGSGTGLEKQSETNLPVKGYCFTRAYSCKIPSNPTCHPPQGISYLWRRQLSALNQATPAKPRRKKSNLRLKTKASYEMDLTDKGRKHYLR